MTAAPLLAERRWTLLQGDCLERLQGLASESVDALVTDPPAGIGFMGKEWDGHKGGRDAWVAWLASVMAEALRVLKPGAHGLVWALPRTSHWTAWALETAGFEVRDRVSHLFGTGFPKSLDVSKAIDKAAGAEREVVGASQWAARANRHGRALTPGDVERQALDSRLITAPATPEAAQWEGWGTALKPACEDWWLVRKPLIGTVAANVTRFGTGALNVDGCRIAAEAGDYSHTGNQNHAAEGWTGGGKFANAGRQVEPHASGRWPANVCLDEEAAALLDAQSGELGRSAGGGMKDFRKAALFQGNAAPNRTDACGFGDSGGASRFFYTAKADRDERDAGLELLETQSGGQATGRKDGSAGLKSPRAGAGRTGGARNHHPTVKPISLMRWLCRLVTPPGGVVLDPFAGSGTTGVAALHEGLRFLGIERDDGYFRIAQERLSAWAEVQETLTTIEARAAGQLALFAGAK